MDVSKRLESLKRRVYIGDYAYAFQGLEFFLRTHKHKNIDAYKELYNSFLFIRREYDYDYYYDYSFKNSQKDSLMSIIDQLESLDKSEFKRKNITGLALTLITLFIRFIIMLLTPPYFKGPKYQIRTVVLMILTFFIIFFSYTFNPSKYFNSPSTSAINHFTKINFLELKGIDPEDEETLKSLNFSPEDIKELKKSNFKAKIEEKLKRLPDWHTSKLTYIYPYETKKWKTYEVKAKIDRLITENEKLRELYSVLENSNYKVKVKPESKVTSLVKLSLKGRQFEILPMTSGWQSVENVSNCEWLWEITPMERGKDLKLHLILECKDNVGNVSVLSTYSENIIVRGGHGKDLARNWQWIAVTILIPLTTWFVNTGRWKKVWDFLAKFFTRKKPEPKIKSEEFGVSKEKEEKH